MNRLRITWAEEIEDIASRTVPHPRVHLLVRFLDGRQVQQQAQRQPLELGTSLWPQVSQNLMIR